MSLKLGTTASVMSQRCSLEYQRWCPRGVGRRSWLTGRLVSLEIQQFYKQLLHEVTVVRAARTCGRHGNAFQSTWLGLGSMSESTEKENKREHLQASKRKHGGAYIVLRGNRAASSLNVPGWGHIHGINHNTVARRNVEYNVGIGTRYRLKQLKGWHYSANPCNALNLFACRVLMARAWSGTVTRFALWSHCRVL
jgi:hypothetical protein